MTLDALLSRWRSSPDVADNIVTWQTIPAQPAQTEPIPSELEPALVAALRTEGITRLYTHQVEAWTLARQGKNFIVQTGTASGKTLCYNLPVLDALLNSPDACALYIFPTKALAQDQLAKLKRLTNPVEHDLRGNQVQVAIYDGDTPTGSRSAIRARVRLLITNPDMLHTGILPHHTNWARLFEGLRFVIIDEMHTYRGVFGSHVANVLRRLNRIARFYGASPQFIFTSATIGNPTELGQRLIEMPVRLVDRDGAAKGKKHFLIYNPPLLDPDLGIRRSLVQESARLIEDLYRYDTQTVVFARSRPSVEILLTYLRERISLGGQATRSESDWERSIRGYRSGYLPGLRREIELGLRSGEVKVVVATNALELGVDIGGMGAAVLAGYPGTISGTWQQAGRAGRSEDTSLAVLVVSANPLDQFLARQPDYFFGRSPERGLINPDNLLILLSHLRCAAFELPFRSGEPYGNLPGDQLAEMLAYLVSEQFLHQSGDRYFWMADQYPAQNISLRSASAEVVVLESSLDAANGFTTTQIVGKVDTPSAARLVHPGAVYLHEARQYYVRELNLEQKIARLEPVSVDYYTEPRAETSVMLIELTNKNSIPAGVKTHGEVQVHTQVIGYRKVAWHSHETLGFEPLDLPPSDLMTTGYWVEIDAETVEALSSDGLWLNEKNDYGAGWLKIRERVRARDGYRCQVCGAVEGGKAHDVHHKIPFRMFNSIEQANQLTNLITLCAACHRKAETTVRVRSGLAGLAYALGNLAPMYLMCDAGDLGVHADAEAPWAEGRPSVILYDLIPAGIGFSEYLFEAHQELVHQARALVAGCQCSDGCPSCVGPASEQGYGGKKETLALLTHLSSD